MIVICDTKLAEIQVFLKNFQDRDTMDNSEAFCLLNVQESVIYKILINSDILLGSKKSHGLRRVILVKNKVIYIKLIKTNNYVYLTTAFNKLIKIIAL